MSVTLLTVCGGGLSFGCLRARDLRGNDASLLVYEDLRHHCVVRMPREGELLLCEHLHSSVYHPRSVVNLGHLCVRQLETLPSDVAAAYFPLFERIGTGVRTFGTRNGKASP